MSTPTDDTIMADRLAALGNETRLRVFRLLVRAGYNGMNVGEIQAHTGVAPSTLAHHLAALRQAGLIEQTKYGREVLSAANYDAMNRLVAYLTDKCCAGLDACGNPIETGQETETSR